MSGLSGPLGGYLLEEPLGRAESRLWRARPLAGGDPVTLCRIDLAHPEQAAVALAAAAPVSALQHPNVLPIREIFATEDALVVVHDRAEGGSLAELLESHGRLRPGEVVAALAPIGSALQAVHAAGMVHGQLTPECILFTETAVPMLTGLVPARVRGGIGPTRETAAYLDPSVAAGGSTSPDTDVFMLAGVAVHALTGSPLWLAAEPADALAQARAGDLSEVTVRLSETAIPASLASAITAVLTARPGSRGTAETFGSALRHSRQGDDSPPGDEAVVAAEAGAPARVEPPKPHGASPAAAASAEPPVGSPAADDGPGRRDPDPVESDLADTAAGRPDFPRPAAAPAMTRSRRRHERRRRILRPRSALLAILAVVLAAATWAVTNHRDSIRSSSRSVPIPDGGAAALNPLGGSPSSTPTTPGSAAATAPALSSANAASVLAQLDALRERAFAVRAPELLGGVYAPGPLLSHDTATLGYLVPAGCGMQGVHTAYSKVSVVSTATDRAVVAATATLTPSVLVCSGAAKGQAPGSGPTALHIVLSRTKTGYLISGIGG